MYFVVSGLSSWKDVWKQIKKTKINYRIIKLTIFIKLFSFRQRLVIVQQKASIFSEKVKTQTQVGFIHFLRNFAGTLLINAYRIVCENSFGLFCSVKIRNKKSGFFQARKNQEFLHFSLYLPIQKKTKKFWQIHLQELLSTHVTSTLEIKRHKNLLPPKMKEVYVNFGQLKVL